jgi:hypothetical protein
MAATRTMQNEEHESELETIHEGRRLVDRWFDLYNQNLSVGELVNYPLVSFGGARPGHSNLSFSIRHEPRGFGGGTEHRDPQWGFSLIDKIDVLQPTSVKGAVVINFRRLQPDGVTYGIGTNRLTIHTKQDGRWGFQIISSCGLRSPEHVYDASDFEIMTVVRRLIESSVEAYNRRDLGALRDCCNYPFVRLDRLDWTQADEPGALSIDFDALARAGGWEHSTVRYLDVLVPQADDKVVADLTVARFSADGTELPPEGSVYVVTRHNGKWGVQASSTRYGLGGLL